MSIVSISLLSRKIRESLYFSWTLTFIFYSFTIFLFFNWQYDKNIRSIADDADLISSWIQHNVESLSEPGIESTDDTTELVLENIATENPLLKISYVDSQIPKVKEIAFQIGKITRSNTNYHLSTTLANQLRQTDIEGFSTPLNSTKNLFWDHGKIYYARSVYKVNQYEIFILRDLTPFTIVGTLGSIASLFFIILVLIRFKNSENLIQDVSAEFSVARNSTETVINQLSLKQDSHRFAIENFDKLIENINKTKFHFIENINFQTLILSLLNSTKHLFHSLKESQEESRLLAQFTPVGIFSTDALGAITYTNPALTAITQLSQKELISDPWLDSLSERNPVNQALENYKFSPKNTNTKLDIDVRIADGSTRYCLFESEIRLSADGDVAGLVCSITDITELKQVQNRLSVSEARWEFALSGSDQGVWDWNLETDQTYFSEKWASMIDFDQNDLNSVINQWFELIHPEDEENVRSAIRNHMESVTDMFISEHRLQTKNNVDIWFQA